MDQLSSPRTVVVELPWYLEQPIHSGKSSDGFQGPMALMEVSLYALTEVLPPEVKSLGRV